VALGLIALLRHEPLPTPTAAAWTAWGYLVIIGSVFAFTSFVRALRLLPTSLVMTYAYVNPVIAVILGWAILHESITGWTIAGSALVLIGVAGVFRARSTSPR
jgi:drug/metabolite transporter (DMT)-like permease